MADWRDMLSLCDAMTVEGNCWQLIGGCHVAEDNRAMQRKVQH